MFLLSKFPALFSTVCYSDMSYEMLHAVVDLAHWFPTFFGPWPIFLKKYPMDHFAMLTPHEQL